MRDNFDDAFAITIGLEGHPTNDQRDPGGFTIWGLARRYHPEVGPHTAIEYAKKVYLEEYWIPSGCDDAPFPMDICLFDAAVNPQNDKRLPDSGNKELLNLKPKDWLEFLVLRMCRYMDNSKPVYVKGHIFRCLRIYREVKNLMEKKHG